MNLLVINYKPGAGLAAGPVFGAVIDRLHLQAAGKFGLAFPEARDGTAAPKDKIGKRTPPTPGSIMHVFCADAATLKALRDDIERRFSDYVFLGQVRQAPESRRFVVLKKVRDAVVTDTSIKRELRRRMKRAAARGERVPVDEINQRFSNIGKRSGGPNLPTLPLTSLSTRQQFFVRFSQEIVDEPKTGAFDSHGFSLHGTTVPWL